MKYKTLWNARDGSKVIAWESPLEEGVFHFPANSVEIEPPEFDPVSKVCSWNGLKWIVSDLPKKEYDAPPEEVSPDENINPNPELDPISAMTQLRLDRNGRLNVTDWWLFSDTIKPTKRQLDYRKALRDLPATASPTLDENGQLAGVEWPEMPDAEAQSYEDERAREYPPIQEQLDLLWLAMEEGNWTVTKIKNSGFFTTLQAVKDAYPKPE